MRSVEVTAKKVQDAINQGLEQLGVRLDEVTVEVIEQGGLFRKAKVKLTVDADAEAENSAASADKKSERKSERGSEEPKAPVNKENAQPAGKPAKNSAEKKEKTEKPSAGKPQTNKIEKTDKPIQKPEKAEKAKKQKPENSDDPKEKTEERKPSREESATARAHAFEFIKGCIERMGFDGVTFETSDDGTIAIAASEGDDSLIIGRHGETLSALAYLAETGARAEKSKVNITVDCNGYRERRQASLSAMARRKADECVRRHRKIKLEPMERTDRRTVHFALNDDNRVITSSEGKEPYRCVVIIPKNRDRRENVSRGENEEFAGQSSEE